MATIQTLNPQTKILTLEFTNIDSLVEYINQPVNNCFDGMRQSSQTLESANSWKGTRNYNEAVNLLKYGWSEESEKLTEKIKLAKQPTPNTSRRKIYQSVVGYTPIVPNYLMGVPTDMVNCKTIQTKQKVITLNKDISYNAGYSTQMIEDNSIKAYQIMQSIEASGVRCNMNIIWGDTFNLSKNVKGIIIKARIKNSSEKLNVSKTSFPLVHPSMLRRIFFRVLETIPELKVEDRNHQLTGGYGYPMSEPNLKSYVEKQKQYYIPRDIGNIQEAAGNITSNKL